MKKYDALCLITTMTFVCPIYGFQAKYPVPKEGPISSMKESGILEERSHEKSKSELTKSQLLTPSQIRQALTQLSELKKRDGTQAWSVWKKVYNIRIPRKIVADFLKKEEIDQPWTDAGCYLHVLEKMPSSWQERLAHPGVLNFVTGENLKGFLFSHEPSVLLLLAERSRQDPEFKDRLWGYLEESRTNPDLGYAPSNAMSILNASGESFAHMDLRNVKIKWANLQGAFLQDTDFRGAQMDGVILDDAFLEDAKLQGTSLANVRFGQVPSFAGHKDIVWSVSFSPDGRYLASASNDNTVRLWDVKDGNELKVFKGHTNWVHSVDFSPDGHYLASASNDWMVRLWDVGSGRKLKVFKGHTSSVTSVSFSPDGRYLASASFDGTVRLWDVKVGNVKVFREHTIWGYSVSFSPDGRYLASANDNTVRLWDVEGGNELKVFKGHTSSVKSVSFSPDGSYLASASFDGTVRLWDVEGGNELKVFKGHTPFVISVSFSPDGLSIATGGYDGKVRFLDAKSGNELKVFRGHTGPVSSISFSPDGRYLASASNDKTVGLLSVVEESMGINLMARWIDVRHELNLTGADFRDATGLTLSQKNLIFQRGGFVDKKDSDDDEEKKNLLTPMGNTS